MAESLLNYSPTVALVCEGQCTALSMSGMAITLHDFQHSRPALEMCYIIYRCRVCRKARIYGTSNI